MASALELSRLESAFADRADIQEAIKKAAGTSQLINLFNDISSYVSELRIPSDSSFQHTAKKRRFNDSNTTENNTLDESLNGNTNGASNAIEEDTEEALLAVQEISVVIPQRKKYTLEFTNTRIRARDPKTKELVPGIGCKWADIEHAFLLPVPEKSQKQFNYILLPSKSYLPTSKTTTQTDSSEPLIFTIPSTAPKPTTLSGKDISAARAVSDDYKTLFNWALNRQIQSCNKKVEIIEANERQFHSVLRQPHRPNEKAVHVSAFRGSKDGFLFFLETGILWGFKKPVLFLPIDRIASVAYTSVLQRTFNLAIEVFVDAGDEDKEELEFSMLDQEDFAGIDGYVKRYGLQDGSMAVARKAKREGVNVVKNEEGEVVGVEEGGHLARAALEGGVGDEMEGVEGHNAFDEDDEEEEDYDPGSEGESEGEGSSSSEEEDGDGGGGGEEGDADEGSVASDDMLGDDA